MIDVQQIIESAREGMNIETRITDITHPDAPEGEGPAVVAVLVHGENGPEVKLATDIMTELDKRMAGPRRREGRVNLQDVDSFCGYLSRYADPAQSVVYANLQAMTFEAVIDEHPIVKEVSSNEVGTAWRGFRAAYACPRSPEWVVWTKNDGVEMRQEQFADFIEARLEDLTVSDGFPKPNELLMLARSLHIRTKGEFKRELNPTNGNYHLINKTETDTGSTEIPRAFIVAIPVFEGGERYQVEARVRFALGEAGPRFSYTMHRRTEIERDAFGGVRSTIGERTKLPILSGTP